MFLEAYNLPDSICYQFRSFFLLSALEAQDNYKKAHTVVADHRIHIDYFPLVADTVADLVDIHISLVVAKDTFSDQMQQLSTGKKHRRFYPKNRV